MMSINDKFPFSVFKAYSEWQLKQSSFHAGEIQKDILLRGATSKQHDTGGLATNAQLEKAGCFNEQEFYLGLSQDEKECLFAHGNGVMTFGLPGSGKGACVIQPNLAHLGNDWSVVVIDFAGEAYRVSADYRRTLGQNIVVCNPSRLFGIEGVAVDPIAHIRAAGESRNLKHTIRLAAEFCEALLPEKPGSKDEGWVLRGGRDIANIVLVFSALEQPALCCLPRLYDLVSLPAAKVVEFIRDHSRLSYIHQRLATLEEDIAQEATKQLHWKLQVVQEALAPFARQTDLGQSLLRDAYDATELKLRPTTLYLTIPTSAVDAYKSYLSAAISSMVTQLADTDGPQKVLFIIDEASQLPPMKLGRWVRLHRKDNLAFWSFWQSTASIKTRYSEADAADLLESSHIKQYLNVNESELARRLSERAGTKTRFSGNMNRAANGQSAGESNSEWAQKVLPVPDILNMSGNDQIIEITGLPLIKARRYPWWDVDPFADRLKHFSEMPETARYADQDDDLTDDDFID